MADHPIGTLVGLGLVVAIGALALLVPLETDARPRWLSGAGPASPDRLPRALHPVAWWVWAIGLATAASRTTNPLLLGLIIVVAAFVVSERRSDAPWARGFRGYLLAGLLIVVLRVVYRILFGGDYGDHVLVTLPEIPLPDWAVGRDARRGHHPRERARGGL